MHLVRFKRRMALVLCFAWVPVLAQAPDTTTGWSVEDILKQEAISALEISPDGKWVVWAKERPDKDEDKFVHDLYISSLNDTLTYALTHGKFDDTSPRWSPDSRRVAFLSARDEKKGPQIWVIHAFGGEPEVMTNLEKGVRAVAWRSEKELLFTAEENPTLREQELKAKKDDSRVVGDQDHYPPVRLFTLNLETKESRRLSTAPGQIIEFAVSPDGRFVVTNENQSIHYTYDFQIPPRQFLYDLEKQTRRELFTEPHVNPFNYVWTLDSQGFYCTRARASDSTDTYVSVNALYYYDLARDVLTPVGLDWPKDLSDERYHITREGVLVSLANGVTNRLALYRKAGRGWQRRWLAHPQETHQSILDVGRDGTTLVFSHSTASQPDRIYAGRLIGNRVDRQRECIFINRWMQKRRFAQCEIIRWRGARGDSVDGLLYYPQKYQAGQKYPLVTMIHGGPTGVDMDRFVERWSRNPNIWTSRGAFVLRVNYHGSGNYGLEWVESIRGHYYDLEVPDILSGIDYVIGKGVVDPDKLGILGWSNGAILAIQTCIRQPADRFKVLSAGAGDVNWTSDYGNCAFGAAFDNAYFGGPPWEIPQVYVDKSPLFKVKQLQTPTIIFFGTEDTAVPTEQGWEFYRALQQIGQTPVRFLLFPGEPHGLRKISHQRRKMEEEIAWFDQHLFGTFKAPNEALKKKSLLAWHLQKASFARVGGKYGYAKDGRLVPETVACEGMKVGRFEVTQAQFKAFRPDFTFAPGQENFPVHRISYDDALAYCRWLSETTGKTYRLPKAVEMQKLLKLVKPNLANENNLDHWLGYSPSPDEFEMIQPQLEAAEKIAPLLMEVGSCPPPDAALIYDLGGNVAEWVVGEDGVGRVMGLAVTSPADSRAPYQPPPERYIGFRIIEEKGKD